MINSDGIKIYNKKDFTSMRKAGQLAARVLDFISNYIKIGVTTDTLNTLCHNFIKNNNAIPAPLHYQGYPKSICTSINNVVCHGIPSNRKLRNKDVINIDVAIILHGWYGDTSRTYIVGDKDIENIKLCKATYESMLQGISVVKPGVRFYEIGKKIEEYISSFKYSIVEDYCGHGIGRNFHETPNILHYKNASSNIRMEEGMFFTIEPMINLGSNRTKILEDNWTVVTEDGKISAQFEHTIGVTKSGYEIFTKSNKEMNPNIK